MHLITVLLRIALSAVFAVAGVTKLLDQKGTRDAVKNFGAPQSLVPALSFLLPIAELLTAAGLLFVHTTRPSAFAALLMLSVFVIAISVNLARGRTYDCHCFGQLHSRPLGWPTLVRNLIFALGASIVLWQAQTQPRLSIFATVAQLGFFQRLLLLAGVVAVTGILTYLYWRQQRLLLKTPAAPQGLPLDSIAPAFELDAYTGGKTSLAQLLACGKPLLLIFTNPTCGPCVVLFKEIKEWQESHSDQLTIALIGFGTIKENFVNVARNRLGQVLLQQEREVAASYGANVTPTGVVVNVHGRVASPLAAGADEIRRLLATVLENSHGPNDQNHSP
jgi:thiol-disulfide isomerase/thioredoxin